MNILSFAHQPSKALRLSVLLTTLFQTAYVQADTDRLQELERRILELESRLLAQLQAQATYNGTQWSVPKATATVGAGPSAGSLSVQGRFTPASGVLEGEARKLNEGFLKRMGAS